MPGESAHVYTQNFLSVNTCLIANVQKSSLDPQNKYPSSRHFLFLPTSFFLFTFILLYLSSLPLHCPRFLLSSLRLSPNSLLPSTCLDLLSLSASLLIKSEALSWLSVFHFSFSPPHLLVFRARLPPQTHTPSSKLT